MQPPGRAGCAARNRVSCASCVQTEEGLPETEHDRRDGPPYSGHIPTRAAAATATHRGDARHGARDAPECRQPDLSRVRRAWRRRAGGDSVDAGRVSPVGRSPGRGCAGRRRSRDPGVAAVRFATRERLARLPSVGRRWHRPAGDPSDQRAAPSLVVIADTCLCEYTTHGHCGIPGPDDQPGFIDNDRSLELIARMAVAQAEAGADIVAPSDMLDGRVQAYRTWTSSMR